MVTSIVDCYPNSMKENTNPSIKLVYNRINILEFHSKSSLIQLFSILQRGKTNAAYGKLGVVLNTLWIIIWLVNIGVYRLQML